MNEEKDLMEQEINNETDSFEESTQAVADDNFDGDADSVEDTVESYTEEVEEVIEEVVEGAEDAVDELEKLVEEAIVPEKTPMSKAAVGAISSVVTLVVCAIVVLAAYFFTYNPYNANKDGYIETLNVVAVMADKTLDELKAEYSFPADMPGDTYSVAAINYMPVGVYFEKMQGMSPDMVTMYAQMMGIKEEVTPEMPYGQFAKLMNAASQATQENAEEAPAEDAEAAEGEAPAEEAPAEAEAPATEEAPAAAEAPTEE